MGDAGDGGGLSQAIALAHGAGEDGGDELLHLRRERRRSGPNELDFAAERLGHLLLEEAGEERVAGAVAALVPVGGTVFEPHVDEAAEDPGQSPELGPDTGDHLVQHDRCGQEKRRLEGLRVSLLRRRGLEHLGRGGQHGAGGAVPDMSAREQGRDLDGQLHDVRKRQVGQVALAGAEVVGPQSARWRDGASHHGADVGVRQHHTLGVAGGARRVHEHGRVARFRQPLRLQLALDT
mmetsp:Transcript_22085/g.69379  ORF Transcript_22085/g.69379 Transcript_22085/m.69379 type:complete len:236 (+) Transcript_22085:890-1597(+)